MTNEKVPGHVKLQRKITDFINYKDQDRNNEHKLAYTTFTYSQFQVLSAIVSVSQQTEIIEKNKMPDVDKVWDELDDSLQYRIDSIKNHINSLVSQNEPVKKRDLTQVIALTYNQSELLGTLLGFFGYDDIQENFTKQYVADIEEWNTLNHKVKALPFAWLMSHKTPRFAERYIELREQE